MVSSRRRCVSSPTSGRNTAGSPRETPQAGKWFKGLRNIKIRNLAQGAGTGPACRAAQGGVDGFMSRIALYPGSFDPVTDGHLDVVRHAVGLCDRLIVAIGVHSSKQPLFSTKERLDMARAVFAPVAAKAGCAFDCTTYDNLTVAAAQKHGATIMIRGLRDGTDLDFEMQIAGMNETMAPGVQTVFVPASVAVRPITATLVRQIATMGGDVSAFVPPLVAASLKTKFPG
jgi:pantetheine-phosphate adenylyltransferase